jgi:hypothetical protein
MKTYLLLVIFLVGLYSAAHVGAVVTRDASVSLNIALSNRAGGAE